MDWMNRTISGYQDLISSYEYPEKVLKETATSKNLNNARKKQAKVNYNLIDLDLVKGSTFADPRPQDGGWAKILKSAVLRVVFLPAYYQWWVSCTSRAMFWTLGLLYALQLTSVLLHVTDAKRFLLNLESPSMAHSIGPCLATFVMTIIQMQITVTQLSSPPSSPHPHHPHSSQGPPAPSSSSSTSSSTSSSSSTQHTDTIRRKRKKTDFLVDSSSVSDQSSTGSHDTGIDLHQDHDISGDSLRQRKSSSGQKVTSMEYHRIFEDAICMVAAQGGSNIFSPAAAAAAQGGSSKFSPVFRRSSGVPCVGVDADEDTAKRAVPAAPGSSPIPPSSRRLSFEKTSAWLRHQNTRPFDKLSGDGDDDDDDGGGGSGGGRFLSNKHGEDACVCVESCLSTVEEKAMSNSCSRNNLPRSRAPRIEFSASNKDVEEMNHGVKNDDTPDKVFVMVNDMMVNVSDMPENDTVENQDIWPDDRSAALNYLASKNNTVSCVVWEMEKAQKVELTGLEICSRLMQERGNGPDSCNDLFLNAALALALMATPVVHRFYCIGGERFTSLDSISLSSLYSHLETVTGENWSQTFAVANVSLQRFLAGLFAVFLLSVAERALRHRLSSADNFCSVTSLHRARKNDLPHFRLNRVQNIRTWLCIRSFLKSRSMQQSIEKVIADILIVAVVIASIISIQLLHDAKHFLDHLGNWDLVVWCAVLGIFLAKLINLSMKINKKYCDSSALIAEQINLFLRMEHKREGKEELMMANSVLNLAEKLLKDLEDQFRLVSCLSSHPLLCSLTKLTLLSAISAVLKDLFGFKVKLYNINLRSE